MHRAHLEVTSPFMNLSTDEGRPILSRAAAISDLRVVAKVSRSGAMYLTLASGSLHLVRVDDAGKCAAW